jgi:glycosyltransferase involved in cell wall biosynthesis
MIENISKYEITRDVNFDFTIFIPTWNNLGFILNCLDSIKKNSMLKIQPIVIINDGKDGTLDWFLNQNEFDYIHSIENIGICYALNIARSLVKSDYIIYANDDMYFLPDWDKNLLLEIQKIGNKAFMLSSTMIEPDDTGNKCISLGNYGKTLADFQEKRLMGEYQQYFRTDWKGSTWPPNVVHRDVWDLVGGFSVEFSPGMYSDPDFSMKLYQAGVRHFKGVGNSLVYHFGSKSTKRVKKNKGRNTFLMKWGMTANHFSKVYLQTGSPWDEKGVKVSENYASKMINTLKRMLGALE